MLVFVSHMTILGNHDFLKVVQTTSSFLTERISRIESVFREKQCEAIEMSAEPAEKSIRRRYRHLIPRVPLCVSRISSQQIQERSIASTAPVHDALLSLSPCALSLVWCFSSCLRHHHLSLTTFLETNHKQQQSLTTLKKIYGPPPLLRDTHHLCVIVIIIYKREKNNYNNNSINIKSTESGLFIYSLTLFNR